MGPTGDLSLGGRGHSTRLRVNTHRDGGAGIQYLVKISPDTARYSNIVMGPYRDFMSSCDKAHITSTPHHAPALQCSQSVCVHRDKCPESAAKEVREKEHMTDRWK